MNQLKILILMIVIGFFELSTLALLGIKKDCAWEDTYKLGKEIDRGVYGIVFEAIRKSDSLKIVIKKQKKNDSMKSFKTEIKVLMKLKGKSYVPNVYDSWVCEEDGFIALERLEDCQNSGSYNSNNINQFLSSVEKILKALNKEGFTHGDLHEGNIMCRPPMKQDFGNIVLIDFGLAEKIKKDSLERQDEQIEELRTDMKEYYLNSEGSSKTKGSFTRSCSRSRDHTLCRYRSRSRSRDRLPQSRDLVRPSSAEFLKKEGGKGGVKSK